MSNPTALELDGATPATGAVAPPDGELRPYPLLTIADLAKLPPPRWIIDQLVPEGLSVTYGPAGVGKSFLELDWALCVATETPWYGRPVVHGPALYIAAEGVSGIYQRAEAWLTERGLPDAPHFHVLPEPVNFLNPGDVLRVMATIAAMPRPPVWITVDTIARTMVGGEENSARDMGLYIANAVKVRPAGARVGLVHHTGKLGDDERGSSALRGAADLMAQLKDDGAAVRLSCSKMKDAPEWDDWKLHLAPVAKSCVIRLGTPTGRLAPAEHQLLRESHEAFGTREASAKALREASDLKRTSYYRALESLKTRDYLAEKDDGRTKTYHVTATGLNYLSPNESQPSQWDQPKESHPSRPLRDGGTADQNGTLADLTDDQLTALADPGATVESRAT